jgi:hypothetical protein
MFQYVVRKCTTAFQKVVTVYYRLVTCNCFHIEMQHSLYAEQEKASTKKCRRVTKSNEI